MTDCSGTQIGATVKYLPFGETRSGSVPTDKLFTGQRLDNTGLYYYNARYYDPTIGRFISPDTYIQDYKNPQDWNKYSYVLNNPLKYTDPTGHFLDAILDIAFIIYDVVALAIDPSAENIAALTTDALCLAIPGATGGGLLVRAATHADDAAKFVNKALDTGKAIDKAVDTGKAAKAADITGDTYSVYKNVDKATGNVDYIGMTSNFSQRATQQAKNGRAIEGIKGLTNLTKSQARAAEQTLIDLYGLPRSGGTLTNKINSIAKTNPVYKSAQQEGQRLLRLYGIIK